MTGGAVDSTRPRDATTQGAERARLRADLGLLIAHERIGQGWTQRQLAERAGCGLGRVRGLEQGRLRPSTTMTARLAAALRPDCSAVEVAVLDLRLQRAAGDSLRVWRTRPPSVRRARVYEQARARLDGGQPAPGAVLLAGRLVAALDAEVRRAR